MSRAFTNRAFQSRADYDCEDAMSPAEAGLADMQSVFARLADDVVFNPLWNVTTPGSLVLSSAFGNSKE